MTAYDITESSGYTPTHSPRTAPTFLRVKIPKLSQPAEPEMEVVQRAIYRKRTIRQMQIGCFMAGAAFVLLVQHGTFFDGSATPTTPVTAVVTAPAVATAPVATLAPTTTAAPK